MAQSPIVITDSRDEDPRPGTWKDGHEKGKPHRSVHLEIVDPAARFLICRRGEDDDRWEIPGGHVDWLSGSARAETYEEAALREGAEETRLVPRDYTPEQLAAAAEELRRLANPRPVAYVVNQVPSSQGNNNEHVAIYRFTFPDELKARIEDVGDHEAKPEWLTEKEIAEFALRPENWMRINAALRLFLRRRGVLVPRILEPDAGK